MKDKVKDINEIWNTKLSKLHIYKHVCLIIKVKWKIQWAVLSTVSLKPWPDY